MTRATLGLLNYTTFGLGPALTRIVAEAERGRIREPRPYEPEVGRAANDLSR